MCLTTAGISQPAPNRLRFVNGTSKNIAGICWTQSNGDDIDRLNVLVKEKTQKFIEESKLSGEPLPVEVQAIITGNLTVYKKRWMWVPVLYSLASVVLLIYHVNSPLTVLFSAIFSFLWYDFFSGVLHIVLDNPEFVNVPVLCDPCLEFQWHHHIPTDLACKPFLQVCGDLNLVISILVITYLCPYLGFGYHTPMALCLVGSKVLMAYFGQLCHCMSHMPVHNRPEWVTFLQNSGLMISPKQHMIHHASYNDNFCIGSGLCNGLISWLKKNVTSNKWCWLGLFLVTLIADVPLANYLLCNTGFK